MRIVHIITRMIVGGAQQVALLCCEGLHDRGHDITLLTGPPIGPEGSLLERAQSYGYHVEVIDEMRRSILPVKDWRTYQRLARRLESLRPDIVHTHSSKAGIIGRWAAHRAGVPATIHTIHGLAFTSSNSSLVNGVYKILERETAPITSKIICVADAMRVQSLAAHIGRPEQYVTIYAGMDVAPYLNPPVSRHAVRAQSGLSDDHIVVGTIARLFHLKGHEDLIETAPELSRRHPQMRWLWVGDGILRPALERRIEQLGVRDRFILTGLVEPERVAVLANAMDIVAHPSRREGLPLALVQGSLAARPVISYDIDGAREAMVDGETGYLVPPFDRKLFADRISALAAAQDLRHTIGSAGRRFALARFDATRMVESIEKLYRQLLNSRKEHE